MLGFLGLVGFLLKDYLPGMLTGIIARDDTEEITPVLEPAAPKIPAPPVVSGSSVTDSAPKQQGTAEKTTVPLVTESTRPAAMPKTAGFDPTEPVAESPLKADATAAGTPPQPPVTTALPQEMTATRTAIVEETAAPGSIPQEQAPTTPEIAEDSPAEAAPAIESLKKFLSAGSLNERLKHTLGAEHMQPLMERYYKHSADGPVRVDRIQFIRMDPNPELGAGRHCIFSLENKTWEFPVPVMLEEQKDGFKVDWLAFVEFKDRMLEKFLQAYQEGPPARFHVGIIRHHYFEDNVPSLDRKDAFRISPAPPNTFHAYAFLDKESPLAQELRARLPWETHVWAIVELEWKKLGSQQWVEVSAMPQMHWYSLPVASKPLPAAPKPKPISTTQKFAEPEEEMPPGISKNGKGSGKSSGKNTPPPGISKSTPDLPTTIRRPLPAGR